MLSAVAAFLQNDAANRQSSAVRDVQRYAASQLSAALQAAASAQNFDAAVQRDWLNLAYERSLLLDSGTVTDATRADQLAELMRLTAGFSPMLQEPYLNDPIEGSIDLPRYYADQEYEPTYWQQRREAASLINDAWNTKSPRMSRCSRCLPWRCFSSASRPPLAASCAARLWSWAC